MSNALHDMLFKYSVTVWMGRGKNAYGKESDKLWSTSPASNHTSWQFPQKLQNKYSVDVLDIKEKVKESRNRAGVAVPKGSSRCRHPDFMTFGTWRWWGCHPHAPAAFTPRRCSWYSFSLGAGSTPGSWYGRKEYVTEKSSDTTGNRSQDLPTSSAAP